MDYNTLVYIEPKIEHIFKEYRTGSYFRRPLSKRSVESWLYFDIFFVTCEELTSMKTILDVRKRCLKEHPHHFSEIEEQFIFALTEYSQELYENPFLKVADPQRI